MSSAPAVGQRSSAPAVCVISLPMAKRARSGDVDDDGPRRRRLPRGDPRLLLEMMSETMWHHYDLSLLEWRAVAGTSHAAARRVYDMFLTQRADLVARLRAANIDVTLAALPGTNDSAKVRVFLSMLMFYGDLRDQKTGELCDVAQYFRALLDRSPALFSGGDGDDGNVVEHQDIWARAYDMTLRINRIATQMATAFFLQNLDIGIVAANGEFRNTRAYSWYRRDLTNPGDPSVPNRVPTAAGLAGRNYLNLTRPRPPGDAEGRHLFVCGDEIFIEPGMSFGFSLLRGGIGCQNEFRPPHGLGAYSMPVRVDSGSPPRLVTLVLARDPAVVVAEFAVVPFPHPYMEGRTELGIDLRYINPGAVHREQNRPTEWSPFVSFLAGLGSARGIDPDDMFPDMHFYLGDEASYDDRKPSIALIREEVAWDVHTHLSGVMTVKLPDLLPSLPTQFGYHDYAFILGIYGSFGRSVGKHALTMREELSPERRAHLWMENSREIASVARQHLGFDGVHTKDAMIDAAVIGMPEFDAYDPETHTRHRIQWSSPLLHCAICTSESPTHIDVTPTAPIQGLCRACTAPAAATANE